MSGHDSETNGACVRDIGAAWAIAVLTIVIAVGLPLG
jgi:hypothetical protein